jgi:hypothetical protein
MRKEHRLRMFETRLLRRTFGHGRKEGRKEAEGYIKRSFIMCRLY